ncbi:MAG: hypothetical protein WC982_11460 [Advenella sp.]
MCARGTQGAAGGANQCRDRGEMDDGGQTGQTGAVGGGPIPGADDAGVSGTMRREGDGAQRRQAWAHQRCTFRLRAADHAMRMQRVGGGSAPDAPRGSAGWCHGAQRGMSAFSWHDAGVAR